MKTTRYFDRIRNKPDRRSIKDAWISRVILNPDVRSVQNDGRIRLCGPVPDVDNCTLCVVLLPDGVTVHDAFFDEDQST